MNHQGYTLGEQKVSHVPGGYNVAILVLSCNSIDIQPSQTGPGGVSTIIKPQHILSVRLQENNFMVRHNGLILCSELSECRLVLAGVRARDHIDMGHCCP
ncbi:hypothetical protein GOBAR_DD11382 [Gossypium barbadense]|nr:hypothetical protein GOBAR_DD11382 [Gossypium barbadense]